MSFKTLTLEQRTPEWHTFRKGKIGSSMAGAIMGVDEKITPLMLWEEITFDLKRTVTPGMKRGADLEETARKWVNDHLNACFDPIVIQSVEFPELIASLDGYEKSDGGVRLIEIKCPKAADHTCAKNGSVPVHYMPQLQHIMMVSDLDSMKYVSFDGEVGIIINVQRDKEYCKKLFCEEMAFLARLNDFKPPEPCDRDWMQVVDSEKQKKLSRLKTIRTIQKDLHLESKILEAEIKMDLTHPRTKIGNAKIQKIFINGRIQYQDIPELQDVDLEKYRGEKTEFWRIDL